MDRRTAFARLASAALVPGAMSLALTRSGASSTVQLGPPDDVTLQRWLHLGSVPSLSMAIVQGGRISTRAIGVRRAGESDAVTADTVYAAASLTKPIVAYTALALVGEGALSLDRPVHEYLALPNPDDARARGITARHLLSHSSGWRNWRNTASQALVADFDPGSRWSYSGEGYFFLQRILERLTGKAIGTLVQERVLTPLGMQRSAMLATEALEPSMASPHSGRGEPMTPYGREALLTLRRTLAARGATAAEAKVEDSEAALRESAPSLPVLPNFLVPNAAASLVTTAADFGRFVRHLVTARAAGGAAASIVAQMMAPQVRCNDALQWGLGVGLESTPAGGAAWQWGDNPGFKNFFFANPATGEGMVVFTNGDRGARVYERVIRATTGNDRAAFLFL
jgi:CubicO group peptidase (beta-lactamase class C family)